MLLLAVFHPIENAEKGQLSFVSQEKFADYIFSSDASVIIVSEKFVKEGDYKSTLILVEDAYLSFQVLMNLYQQMREEKKSGIEQFLYHFRFHFRRRSLYRSSYLYF